MNSQALAGIRVLDMSGTIAGSVAAMLLGDYGAEVIHVDPPTRQRKPAFAGGPMWHRNKTIVAVDWSLDDEIATLQGLLRGADVVITTDDYTVECLGMGEKAHIEGLIHLAMPTGTPAEAGDVEIDALLSAVSGLAARQPSFSGDPVDAVYPFVLYAQAAWGAISAVAALYARELSGQGQAIVVDGLHGALLAGCLIMVADPTLDPVLTSGGPNPAPNIAPYRCADGEWLFFIAVGRFIPTALAAIGLSSLLDDERVAGDLVKLFANENRSWVREALAATFATQTREHWQQVLADAGCPAGIVSRPDQWLDHPQVDALGLRSTVDDPEHGRVVMPGAFVDLSQTPAKTPEPRRILTEGLVADWAARTPRARTTGTPQEGGPLAGIRVLNTGLFIAGPFGGMLLAELGADVIKVEKLSGNNNRDGSYHWIRGQRSLAVDLHQDRGRNIFLDLVAQADVVMDNFRPGVLRRLQLDYDVLENANPNLISASVTSFGDVGPHAGEPGMDPMIQAMSGIMAAQGGHGEPVSFASGVIDVFGAVSTVLGVCLALFHRARTGDGQRVHANLVAASLYVQSGEIVRYGDRVPGPSGGDDFKGPSALSRIYATQDGHVRIHSDDPDALSRAGFLSSANQTDEQAAAEIQGKLGSLSRAQAEKELTDAGILCVPVRHINEFVTDARSIERDYIATLESIEGARIYVPHRFARFSGTEQQEFLRPSGIGEHSREILREAGVASDVIDELISSGVVREGPPVLWFSPTAGQW